MKYCLCSFRFCQFTSKMRPFTGFTRFASARSRLFLPWMFTSFGASLDVINRACFHAEWRPAQPAQQETKRKKRKKWKKREKRGRRERKTATRRRGPLVNKPYRRLLITKENKPHYLNFTMWKYLECWSTEPGSSPPRSPPNRRRW